MQQQLFGLIHNAIQLANSGNITKSKNILSTILAAHPDFFAANYHYSSLMLQSGEYETALKHARKAVEINPSDIKALWLLSEVYYQTGRLREGMDVCTAMLAIKRRKKADPEGEGIREISILTKLGDLHMQSNQYDQAEHFFDQALQIEPENLLANFLLAKIHRSTGRIDDALLRLEKLIASSPGNPITDVYAKAELALLYDRTNRYAEALEAATISNQTLAAYPVSRSIDKKAVPGLIDRMAKYVFANPPATGDERNAAYDTPAPVFLVGFPRSGTTLTEQLLADRLGLVGSTELPFIDDTRQAIPALLKKEFTYPDDIHTLTIDDIGRLRRHYWQLVDQTLHLQKNGAARLLDKMPMNILHLPFITTIFPESKLIVALRDPRDTCQSCFFHQFRLNESMIHFLSIDDTVAFYNKVMGFWLSYRQTGAFSYLESRYEDIVQDQAEAVARIGAYLGIHEQPSAENTTSPDTAAKRKRLMTPSSFEATQPVYRRSMERWRNYVDLLPGQFAQLKTVILELGYGV
jgi:tetratricopeptide (TPR) repeat protein